MISLIAAMARNRVIGKDNAMPWHLPADLAHFKRVTMGKPVIMGRNTFESIGRPLPGRKNVVISRNPDYQPEGCVVVSSIDAAIDECVDSDEVMIIGGGQLYQAMLPRADRLYLTLIEAELDGDTQFPDYTEYGWEVVDTEHYVADECNQYDLEFVTLDREASSRPSC
jgi:dihydrofolate reductase